ncbi:MAG: CHRD domain-containing protein [bacterium]
MDGLNVNGRNRLRPLHFVNSVLALFVRGVGVLLLAACGSDGSVVPQRATYVATLTGSREIPPVVTTATGKATFTLVGQTVTYTVLASGFATPLTVGHVLIGPSGTTGLVIVPFNIIAQSGTVASGSIDLSVPITFGNVTISGDSLHTLFETSKAYVNLHTAAFPGGELRGQIVKQ